MICAICIYISQFNEYENEIVAPISIGVIVCEHTIPYRHKPIQRSTDSSIPSLIQGDHVVKEVCSGLSKLPHVPPPVYASESVTSIVDKSCVVCG